MFVNTAGMHMSLKVTWRSWTLKSNETKTSSPSKPPRSKHPHNSLSRFCSSLLIQSRPYNSWCTLLLILNKIIKCEFLIMGVQQLEYILSIIHTNFCACINILQLGAMTCAEQCKLRQRKLGNDNNFKSYSFTHFVCKTTQRTSVALAINGLWTVVRHRKPQDGTVSLIF